ncbi:hypothetical protein [Flavobacterium aurantiibacter]|nr:hypothetical protein [Flavobacterium aurantiibacter]
MKKLLMIAIVLTRFVGFAQEKEVKTRKAPLTPEQRTELRVKELTLQLELTAAQQKEIKQVFLEAEKKREAAREELIAKRKSGVKPTEQDRFDMKNKILDEKIALRDQMKKILKAEQFAKWEASRDKRADKIEKKLADRRRGKNLEPTLNEPQD